MGKVALHIKKKKLIPNNTCKGGCWIDSRLNIKGKITKIMGKKEGKSFTYEYRRASKIRTPRHIP